MSEEELIKLAAPEDASAASWNGKEFPVQDGLVSVPRAAMDDLLPHGFSLPKPRKPKASKEPKVPSSEGGEGNAVGQEGGDGAGEGAGAGQEGA